MFPFTRFRTDWPDKGSGPLSKDDATAFRQRVEKEDEYLRSRTTIVVSLNALGAAFVGLATLPFTRPVVATAAILIDIFWLICATDAMWLLHCLHGRLSESTANVPVDEAYRAKVQKLNKHRMSTTLFMSFWVPAALLLAWIVGVGISVWLVLAK